MLRLKAKPAGEYSLGGKGVDGYLGIYLSADIATQGKKTDKMSFHASTTPVNTRVTCIGIKQIPCTISLKAASFK